MHDLHIDVDDGEITCVNCATSISPADADSIQLERFEAGYYNCPNCFINITISAETAKDANLAILNKSELW